MIIMINIKKRRRVTRWEKRDLEIVCALYLEACRECPRKEGTFPLLGGRGSSRCPGGKIKSVLEPTRLWAMTGWPWTSTTWPWLNALWCPGFFRAEGRPVIVPVAPPGVENADPEKRKSNILLFIPQLNQKFIYLWKTFLFLNKVQGSRKNSPLLPLYQFPSFPPLTLTSFHLAPPSLPLP